MDFIEKEPSLAVNAFHIGEIRKRPNRVDTRVQYGEKISEIYFECEDSALVPSREALVAVTLFPAMRNGAALQVGGEISAQLLDSLPVIQDVYHSWFPDTYQHIEIKGAIPVEKANTKARRVGVFFSGGVDSWYSLIKNQETITDLVLGWGLDIPLEKLTLAKQTRDNVQKVATVFGKNMVVMRTNLREFTERHVPWNWMFGAGLSAIGHLLSGEFRGFHLSSGQWYGHQIPCASHVLLDPRWSSEAMEIVHEGLEASRLEKIRILAQHEIALQTLRVCWRNPEEEYNCGRCEKCLRTMVALQAVGALERCATFRNPIDTRRLAQVRFLDDALLPYAEESLHALEKQPWNHKIYNAQRKLLLRYYFKHFLFQVHSLYPWLLKRAAKFTKKM